MSDYEVRFKRLGSDSAPFRILLRNNPTKNEAERIILNILETCNAREGIYDVRVVFEGNTKSSYETSFYTGL